MSKVAPKMTKIPEGFEYSKEAERDRNKLATKHLEELGRKDPALKKAIDNLLEQVDLED